MGERHCALPRISGKIGCRKGGRAARLEKDPSLRSGLISELECLYSKLCKTTACMCCLMGPLADYGLGLKF